MSWSEGARSDNFPGEDIPSAENGAATTETSRKFENEVYLNPDPAHNPFFQKVVGYNLSNGGAGIGVILRNQLLTAFGTANTSACQEGETPFLTTSEWRTHQFGIRKEALDTARTRFGSLKSSQKDGVPETLTSSEQGDVPVRHSKTERHTLHPSDETLHAKQRERKKRKPKPQEPIQEVKDAVSSPSVVTTRFVSLWEKYKDAPDPVGDVETDVAPPKPRPRSRRHTSSGPKRYNVSFQVRPKDIRKVITGRDAALIITTSRLRVITPSVASLVEPGKMMDATLMVRPKNPHLRRGDPPLSNASTQTRPRGYRQLNLNTDSDVTLNDDKQVEALELTIEQEIALREGIALPDGDIVWPVIDEFFRPIAESKLRTYIRCCWKLGPEWMYDIRFIQQHSNDYRKRAIYEIVFSTPTNAVPVPPATASVFFVFETEHYNCPEATVKVHYVLEGNRLPYTPAKIEFREEWLHDIIEEKLKIRNALKFCAA